MKFNEFNNDARKQLAERKGLTEEQLDEILPAIAAIGRVAATGAARGAAALARGAAKGAASLGRAGAKAAGRAAGAAGRSAARGVAKSIGGRNREEPETNDPNDTVGTQDKVPMGSTGTQGTQGTRSTSSATNKQPNIKAGQTIKLPAQTTTGKPGPQKPFKITKVKGDEVEIKNPMPKPGEPDKVTYKMKDLEGVLGNETK